MGGSPAWFRVGPYEVLRPLVRAPGAFFAEARGPNQETVLLQMTPMRAAEGQADTWARDKVERGLAQQTAALFVERDIVVMAHGGATREDGARVLFWALPWRPEAERLGQPALYVEGAEHLLVLCLSLARRLARRHVLNGHEPLLTEHVVAVQSTGAELIAVPVAVPPTWLAPEAPSPRWAPEERQTGESTRPGDLWRLGHAFGALASAFDTVPQGLDRLIKRLTERDPAARPPRATEVVVELESIYAALSKGLPLVPLEGTPTISMQALPIEALSALMHSAVGHTTCEMALQPVDLTLDESAEATIRDMPIVDVQAQVPEVSATPMLDRVPPWAFFFTLDELRAFLRLVSADLQRRELDFSYGTGAVQLALGAEGPSYTLELVSLAHACHVALAPEWPVIIRAGLDRLLESTAQLPQARLRPDSDAPPPAPGEAGPTLVLPTVKAPREPSGVPPPLAPRVPSHGRIPPPPAPRRDRLFVFAGLAALFLFGVVLVGARTLNAGTWRAHSISTEQSVALWTEPPNALIVAERDGRVLGRSPQHFFVGPESTAVVLITAPGYEPQRVTLPSHGRIDVRLERLSPEVEACALDLPHADLAAFEAVGGTFEASGRLVVNGAAVVRARRDSGALGAWLVRCGSGHVDLRRAPLPRVMVRMKDLPEAELAVDGHFRPAGEPYAVQGAFTRLRISGQERWIPTTASVDLQH